MKIAAILTLMFAGIAFACPVGKSGPSKAEQEQWRKESKAQPAINSRKVANSGQIPAPPTASSSEPWGGADQSKWKPEAVLANAVSRALNEGWKVRDVQDVLISVPVKMKPTTERPYYDGQTNATFSRKGASPAATR